MYNDELKNTIINDLESKAIALVDTSIALASQGYLINKNKHTRLDWTSVMLHAFENIDVLSEEQQSSVERIYNKLSSI